MSNFRPKEPKHEQKIYQVLGSCTKDIYSAVKTDEISKELSQANKIQSKKLLVYLIVLTIERMLIT